MADPGDEFSRFLEDLATQETGGPLGLLLKYMEPETALHLRLCAIPHQFNPDVLQVMSPGLTGDDARGLCEEYSRLAIVVPRRDEQAFHDDARRDLFSHWLRDPGGSQFADTSAAGEILRREGRQIPGRVPGGFRDRAGLPPPGSRPSTRLRRVPSPLPPQAPRAPARACEALVRSAHEYDSVLEPDRLLRLVYCQGLLSADRREWRGPRDSFASCLAATRLPLISS